MDLGSIEKMTKINLDVVIESYLQQIKAGFKTK